MSDVIVHQRRSDGVIGQLKAIWPVLAACCVAYAAFQTKSQKLDDTTALAISTSGEVSVLKQNVAVQTAMLGEIRDAVRDLTRHRRPE